jgi:hypothetical protein
VVTGPHDHRSPVVPAIQRVAPVAHIALVLRGIRLEAACRGGCAHLIGVHEQRGLLQAGTVWPGPAGKGDFSVDQVLNVVLAFAAALVTGVLAIVFVVVVIPVPILVAFASRERAVRCLDVGERENGFTACFAGGAPQQGRLARVRAFQPLPVQPPGRVLVVEEVDEPVRRAGCGSAVVAGHRRAEVRTEEIRQFSDGSVVARRTLVSPCKSRL